MAITDPKQLWKTALAQIEIKIDSPAQYKTFFQGTKLVEVDPDKGKAKIGVANAYMSDWLEQKYRDLIEKTVSHVYGEKITVEFMVESDFQAGNTPKIESRELLSSQTHPTQHNQQDSLLSMQGGMHNSVTTAIKRAGLNDKYSMSNYIVGPSNQIAHAAATAVADNPGAVYNPLFIHGKTGVGKTHLAQAIGRSILERSPNKKIVYTSSEGFLNDLVKAIRTNKQIEFRNRYRAVNVLIIDDIQLISKWVGTQDEFFNTFNELYNNNAHVIMVSDRPPEEIKDLQDRLRSRFQGGIVVEIHLPDFETRLAILDHNNNKYGYDLSSRLLEGIAQGVNDNIRELEGVLQKVALFNQMKPSGDLSIEELNKIIGNDTESKREKITVPQVIKNTAQYFGVTVKDIKGKRRTKDIALARQVAMYILREEFDYNLEIVAKFVNRNDHTTVIHAVDKIKSLILSQDGFKEQVVTIIRSLEQSTEIE